jgi:hypothetical protein
VLVEQVGHKGQVQPVVAFDNVLGKSGVVRGSLVAPCNPSSTLPRFATQGSFKV